MLKHLSYVYLQRPSIIEVIRYCELYLLCLTGPTQKLQHVHERRHPAILKRSDRDSGEALADRQRCGPLSAVLANF